MKKRIIAVLLTMAVLFCNTPNVWAGEMDILVGKLVEKGILTPYEGQILMAQAKEEAAKDLKQAKASTAPEWVQRVELKGDVRARTQMDWGKGMGPAHQRVRERVRARVGIDAKINDQVNAGGRFVTGTTDARSTNQTLDNNFMTYDARFDQYYIHWTPKLPETVGTGGLWVGKFAQPFVTSEMLWDNDINPAGAAGQYMSPKFNVGEMQAKAYGNAAIYWLDEMQTSERDPMMGAGQVGIIMDVIPEWDSQVNIAGAYYGLTNVNNNKSYSYDFSSGTNTLWSDTAGSALGSTYRYDYHILDLLVNYDSMQIFDFAVGNGLYGDFVCNAAAPNNNLAWQLGGYLGTKSPKEPGQWKVWTEARYMERDSIPDFLPDSDFYGFTISGTPVGGGTATQGINCGIDYAIFKNTVLSAEYYWTTPINVTKGIASSMDEAYQILQLDIKTKF